MQLVELIPNINVSRLCYGSLAIGPLQRCLSPQDGGRLIRLALESGINFFDTAELYGTYEHLAVGFSGWQKDVVIATKSYACDRPSMQASLEKALRLLKRDYIDIFLLHEQDSKLTLRGHQEALEYLQEAKQRGTVRAIGISTHSVVGVKDGTEHDVIEIIHP
ncbi:MAG: aldo/keto reductase, partial [bacterium]|nr:aldo/keto reductase [bacterium]